MSSVIKEAFAKESGHWYSPDGEPRYTIIGANGKERPTTVRDARKYGYVPSVTTILKLAAAPGLERWKIGNAIMSALTLPREEGEADDDYITRIVRDSEAQAKKSRERGTAIHGSIETIYKRGRMASDDPYADHAAAAYKAVSAWAGDAVRWDAERSFACSLGYGGKLDLSSRDGWIVDFKTTDKPLDGIKTWPEHRRQLAAYSVGLGMQDARCAICYVATGEPGAIVLELDADELGRGWREFHALLALWRATNLEEVTPC